jgi:hypothetical protein
VAIAGKDELGMPASAFIDHRAGSLVQHDVAIEGVLHEVARDDEDRGAKLRNLRFPLPARQTDVRSRSSRGALPNARTRRARLIEQARLLRQHAVQVIETVKNPQSHDPSADLNRRRAVLHRSERSSADPKALGEDGHGVVTRETQNLEAEPEFRQVLPMFFNFHFNVGYLPEWGINHSITEINVAVR